MGRFAFAMQLLSVIRSHYDTDLKWLDLGEQAIDRALELNPAHPAALCARAQTLFTAARGFQNRKALRATCAALKVDSSYHNALHWRAVLLFHLGHYTQASRDLDDALRIDPPFVGSQVSKAQIALETGNAERFAELYERLLEQEPRMIHALLLSPLPSIWLGRLDEAQRKIQRTRANYPSEPQITAMEATVASLRGDFQLAESLADQSVAAESGTLHLHHAWHCAAGAYAICGKPEKAMTQLRRSADCGLPNYKLFSRDLSSG
jgi:tetratricopeptide (TPR) repeat protein